MAPISRPRIRRIASSGSLSIRRPASVIRPAAMRSGGSSRPMIAAPVSDLPAPDSPTMPNTSPGAIAKLISSIAVSIPRRVGSSTRKFSTRKSASGMSAQFRIERVAQPVAQEIDRQDQNRQHDSRENRDPPVAREQIVVAIADQSAERRLGRRQPDPEKRQCGLGQNGERQIDCGDYQYRPDHIRQQVTENNLCRVNTDD